MQDVQVKKTTDFDIAQVKITDFDISKYCRLFQTKMLTICLQIMSQRKLFCAVVTQCLAFKYVFHILEMCSERIQIFYERICF